MSLKEKLMKTGVKLVDKCKANSPQILTGTVIFGVWLTGYLAASASFKVAKKIAEEDQARKDDAHARATNESKILGKDYKKVYDEIYEPLTFWDKVKIGWPYYIPPFLSACGTTASAIGNERINSDRLAKETLRTEAAQIALRKYQEKVVEQIGEKKERKVQYAVHEDEIKEKVKELPQDITSKFDPMSGGAVFYDPKSGQIFPSTYERVRRAADRANEALRSDEFYSHGLFIEDCGGHISEFSYMNGIMSQGVDRNAIDQDYFLEPHLEEYNGHEITMVYMNYNTVTREYY